MKSVHKGINNLNELKKIDIKKFKKKSIDVCPECKKVVRMRDDNYHAETLCEKCGAVINEKIPIDEIEDICVSDRELEIELNTYRQTSLEKNRVGSLTRYPQLMMKYDRSTEGSQKKWRTKMYKDYVGVVSTQFQMTRTQQIRVKEVIDCCDDLQDLHRQANYESIITALCILSMKRDKRRISFDNKHITKSQFEFLDEIGLTEKKYITIMENCNFPMLKSRRFKNVKKPFKFKKKR